jgi:hypothetical protein
MELTRYDGQWYAWQEGEQLGDHPALLSRANLQTLRKLLTAYGPF